MTTSTMSTRLVREGDFAGDRHAARYRGEFEVHGGAMRRLLEILNDPANEQRLVDAESHDLPALAGIVRQLEDDAAIAAVLATGTSGHRFRQAVGVAVKLKMAHLGWRTTGRKGAVRGAQYFTKAEHYEPDRPSAADHRTRGLAALDAVSQIGDERERAETGRQLSEALAATRAAEGRRF